MVSDIPKSRLNSSALFVRRFEKECWTKSTTFSWAFDNFFRMNYSTVCRRKVEKLEWLLVLTKEGYSISVTLDTNGCEMLMIICCWISFNDIDISDFYYASQISKGLYSVNIPSAAVKRLKSKQQKDRKVLKLYFETGVKSGEFVHPNINGRMLKEFSRDDIHMIQNLTDFNMRSGEGQDIGCHKAILSARSNFFRNCFVRFPKAQCIALTAKTKILCAVIFYLYRSELYPENAEEMVDIMKVAWELDIPGLKSRCEKFFHLFVNADNVHWIKEEGIKSNLKILVQNADYFLACMNTTAAQRADSSEDDKCRSTQFKGRKKK